MKIIAVISAALVMAFMGDSPVTVRGGSYVGTCTNQTFNITSEMRLNFVVKNGEVTGHLQIFGRLHGGGNLTGVLDGDELLFATSAPGYEIIWLGRIEGKTITGVYAVDAIDGSIQEGTWTVNRN